MGASFTKGLSVILKNKRWWLCTSNMLQKQEILEHRFKIGLGIIVGTCKLSFSYASVAGFCGSY